MNIKEFAEKYEVERRMIDYWTNLGLLTTEKDAKNGYRIYGKKAEEEIKLILIAKAMGANPLEEYVDMLNHCPSQMMKNYVVKEIEKEMERATKSYRLAIKWAKEIGAE